MIIQQEMKKKKRKEGHETTIDYGVYSSYQDFRTGILRESLGILGAKAISVKAIEATSCQPHQTSLMSVVMPCPGQSHNNVADRQVPKCLTSSFWSM